MSLVRSCGSNLAVWYRRHSLLALHLGSSAALMYYMNIHANFRSYFWPLSLGSVAFISYFSKFRSKLTPKDLIVISGCNSGLGYSLALHCRAQGAAVLAGLHNLSQNYNIPVIEEFKKQNIYYCDLEITNEESVRTFAQEVQNLIKAEQLVLRAVVNNAGVMVFGEFEWQTQDIAEHQVNVNLLGTMRLTRALMPIIRQNCSRIIVVSSHCAHESLPGVSIYGATKAAIHSWASSLRAEVGKYGVKVVCFVPGGFVNESNIMKQQNHHFREMEKHMSNEVRTFYGQYFVDYVAYFSRISKLSSEKKILTNSRIYDMFDNALLDIYPSELYRCESWEYFIYRILFKITPTRIRDWLVINFVRAPKWHVDK